MTDQTPTTPKLEQAQKAADWLRERYGTDRVKTHLKTLLSRAEEARKSLEETRSIYRLAESELGRVDAELNYTVQNDPDLKNADTRKAAFERARAHDSERAAAAGALEAALLARNEASNRLDDVEDTLKSTYLVLALTTAELQALAAVVQLPPF
jgi:hypothetical protein